MFSDVSALASLLTHSEAEEKRRDATASSASVASMTPADLARRAAGGAGGGTSSTAAAASKPKSSKDIWDESAVEEAAVEIEDGRKRPHHDIVMRQSVGAEDVYLGLSGKTPATFDCNEMVIKVQLPGTALKDIELDLKEQRLTLSTPDYKLNLPLPHKVKHKEGNAKWDGAKHELQVRVPVIRADPF